MQRHPSAPKVRVELPTAPLPKILHVSMPPPPCAACNIEDRGGSDAKDGHNSDKSEHRIHGNLPCCRNQSRDPIKARVRADNYFQLLTFLTGAPAGRAPVCRPFGWLSFRIAETVEARGASRWLPSHRIQSQRKYRAERWPFRASSHMADRDDIGARRLARPVVARVETISPVLWDQLGVAV